MDEEEIEFRGKNPFVAVLHDQEEGGWAIQAFPTEEAAATSKLPQHSTEVMTWEAYDIFKAERLAQQRKENPPITA